MLVKLEKYLTRQRKNLDVENPDDTAIWDGIQRRLNHDLPAEKYVFTRTRLIRIRNIVATVIILFSLGYLTNDIINRKNYSPGMILSSIDSGLGRRENDYKKLINLKTEEVRSFAGSDDVVINELFEEIKKLDLIYKQAMIDLKVLGPNEKVIHTIFSTYEQKIRLLELIILETNKTNSHGNNEKIIL
jgi:hypothetical protein